MPNAKIDHSELFYKKVAATSEDSSSGSVIASGQKVAVVKFRANGADPSAYVKLVWDPGGGDEKVIASTRGDIDLNFDPSNIDVQFTGDGTKRLKIVITNDNTTESPTIGGAYEVTKI